VDAQVRCQRAGIPRRDTIVGSLVHGSETHLRSAVALALTVATWRIRLTGTAFMTGGECGHELAVAASLPQSQPHRKWAPAATFAQTFLHQGLGNRCVVVDRRPLSLVLVATAASAWRAMYFGRSSSSIYLAMVTPSYYDVEHRTSLDHTLRREARL